MSTPIKGVATAKRILSKAELDAAEFKYMFKREPKLVVMNVGDNAASQVYIKNKETACRKAGVKCEVRHYGAEWSPTDLKSEIRRLNADDTVDGIILQLPIPAFYNADDLIDLIDPEKDVDGLTSINQGYTLMGRSEGLRPCTPLGIMELLDDINIRLDGKRVAIIGRSILVGRPLAAMMTTANATVSLCHSHTKKLDKITQTADIIVVAVGKADFLTSEMIKPGAVVIDVGINRSDDKLCGDCAENISEVASFHTPVPGGVGPMTVAMLVSNTIKAAYARHDKRILK